MVVPVELSGVQLLTQFYYPGVRIVKGLPIGYLLVISQESDNASCNKANDSMPVTQNPTSSHLGVSYSVTVAAWATSCIINIFGTRYVVFNCALCLANALLDGSEKAGLSFLNSCVTRAKTQHFVKPSLFSVS